MLKSKILILGTGPSMYKWKDFSEEERAHYLTIGANHTEKFDIDGVPVVPDYHCVTNINAYFGKREDGWIGAELEPTTWIFPHKDMKLFVKPIPPNLNIQFIKAQWDFIGHTVFDLCLPLALKLASEMGIDKISILGLDENKVHDDIFKIVKEKFKISIVDLSLLSSSPDSEPLDGTHSTESQDK